LKFHRHVLFHLLWLLPLAFWPGNNSYDAAKFTVLAIAACLWLGSTAWLQWRGKNLLTPGNHGLGLWGNLVLLVWIGIFYSTNPTLVMRTGLLMTLFALVTFQTSRQTGGIAGQKSLLAAITFGAALSGIYGLLQMAHLLPGAPPSSGYPPGISTLGNQNYLAGFMAVAFWPTLVLFRHTRLNWSRLLVAFALAVILLTLLVAGATGPQVAILTAFALVVPCIALVIKGRGKRVPMVLAGLFILMAGSGVILMFDATSAPPSSEQSLNQPLHHQLLSENHGDIRRTDWLTAIEMLKPSPVVGAGLGNYLVLWPEARARLTTGGMESGLSRGAPISTRAHNDLLQWLAETGAIGASFLALLVVIFTLAWRRRFGTLPQQNQVDYLLLTAGVLTVAVHSMVSFPLHLPATSLTLAFLLGLLFLNEEAPKPAKPHWTGKILGLVLAFVALILAYGSLQEFRGDLLTASGRRLFTQGRMEPATAQLERGVQLMKWPGHGHLYLGLAQTALGQTEEAEANFRTSLKDRPSFEAHLALAESAINRGDFSGAEKHLDLVKNCRPLLGFIHQAKFLRGFMLVRQGDLSSARMEFGELLKEDANQHRALLGLGYLETLEGNPHKAKIFYSQALNVIDKQIAEFRTNPGQESAAFLVRLQQNRQVASKALQSLSRTP
jgi:O-antigen ligase/Flp pilus assembly protein TadD